MSRIFHASFDGLTPAQLAQVGIWQSAGSGVVSVAGRTGNGITGTAGATQAQNTIRSRILFPHSPAIGFHGFAVKCSSLPASEQKLWALLADDASVQLTVTIAPTGIVKIYRGTMEAGTLLGSSGLVFFSTAFRYFEVGYTLTGEGRVEVRSHPAASGSPPVFGTPRTLVVTGGTSARAWAQFELYLTEDIILDDLYVNDVADATTGPTYFSGDSTVEFIVPIGVNFEQSWFNNFHWHVNTGTNDAAGKVDMVDDNPFDGDATHLWTRRGLTYIGYDMQDVTPDDGREVVDVQQVAIVRAASSTFRPAFALGAIRWDGISGTTQFAALTSSAYVALLRMVRAERGLGGQAWTIDRINNTVFYIRS